MVDSYIEYLNDILDAQGHINRTQTKQLLDAVRELRTENAALTKENETLRMAATPTGFHTGID